MTRRRRECWSFGCSDDADRQSRQLVRCAVSTRTDGSIGIDCEMVGLGALGAESALARVSLVNYHGYVVLDTFVAPRERVTDWRTWVSGVREEDILGAPSFEEVQKKVAALVEGRVLVGHAIENDLKVRLTTGNLERTDVLGATAEPSRTDGARYAEVQDPAGAGKDQAAWSEKAGGVGAWLGDPEGLAQLGACAWVHPVRLTDNR